MTMSDWVPFVHRRLAELTHGAPDPVLVEELAAHLAQTYEEARADGLSEDEARTRALGLLDAADLLRKTIEARRPRVPQRVTEWSRQEPIVERGAGMSPLTILGEARYALRMLLRAPGFSLIAI